MSIRAFDIKTLVRPHILKLKPYSSARDEYTGSKGIFLDANENPFGAVTGEQFHRYPDPLQKQVKDKLAKLKNVAPENIFLGNGSDEAIDLLFRAFCEPNTDKVLTMPPTYGMYQVSADINLVEVMQVPLTSNFEIDTNTVLQTLKQHKNIKMLFVCSPNNPSGNQMAKHDIEKILQVFAGLVIVDEAYIDFAPNASLTTLLNQYPNLVVLQTFSKAWGMAALRLGMAFAQKEIIQILNKIKPPYNINQLTQEKVLHALSMNHVRKEKVAEILSLKAELSATLQNLPQVEKVHPSDANFILIKVRNAVATYQYLIENLVIVRDRSRVTLCENCLRITVGSQEENQHLIDVLQKM